MATRRYEIFVDCPACEEQELDTLAREAAWHLTENLPPAAPFTLRLTDGSRVLSNYDYDPEE